MNTLLPSSIDMAYQIDSSNTAAGTIFAKDNNGVQQEMAASWPSLCIPRVFPNITRERVLAIFGNLKIGEIERIDMVERTNDAGESYNRVFVHFKHWYDNGDALRMRTMMADGETIKVVYDDPWFWKISASRSQRPEDRDRRRYDRPKPRIDFSM